MTFDLYIFEKTSLKMNFKPKKHEFRIMVNMNLS